MHTTQEAGRLKMNSNINSVPKKILQTRETNLGGNKLFYIYLYMYLL